MLLDVQRVPDKLDVICETEPESDTIEILEPEPEPDAFWNIYSYTTVPSAINSISSIMQTQTRTWTWYYI